MSRPRIPDGAHCHYCRQKPATTWDHIIPLSWGGPNSVRNRVPACRPCNEAKADKPTWCRCKRCRYAVSLWGHLQHEPRVPSTHSIAGLFQHTKEAS